MPAAAGLSKLEQERARRIAENQARLQQIGLLQTVQTIAGTQQAVAAERRAKARASKAARRAASTAVAGRPRRWDATFRCASDLAGPGGLVE